MILWVVLGLVFVILPFVLKRILKKQVVAITVPQLPPWEQKRIMRNMKRCMFNNPPITKCITCPFRYDVLYEYRHLKDRQSLYAMQRCQHDCIRKEG